ncbi:mechanosensitive ion channel family protein [Segetibacter koreensis]|uniref:mechanosensitive ion channel family protein n=1 Tax=Segetibacter koreensis TaxID=398037 RepID=UPI00037911D7|nr:mechanosensitive ion channel family protein [Segetibacter koreensis]
MWSDFLQQLKQLPPAGWNVLLALVAVLTGFIFKGVATLILHLYSKTNLNYSVFRSILGRLNKPLTFFLPLITLNLVLPLMELNKTQFNIINKITGILLIVSFSMVLVAVVKIFEDFLYHIYDLNKSDNLRERKIRTQIQFIRKLIISLIIVLAIGAVLLSFSSLRKIGTGLLTGVGISGIIVGLAAQRSLGNLLAGLQIAFTQPIRLDDVLVVEGEYGRVEEITMTYVVLSVWDQRRLILPINYFIEKPFQNWTRNTAEILGTVFLYLDYSAPFDEIKKEFNRLLEHTDLWDKRVSGMQITNSTESTVEIRFLISAANSGKAFDLRCYIRENIITFIQKNYPDALPAHRAIISYKDNLADAKAEKLPERLVSSNNQ